ncbi:hypothetical protein HHI36_003581, partial [Cryptolaemus montrouzieri]
MHLKTLRQEKKENNLTTNYNRLSKHFQEASRKLCLAITVGDDVIPDIKQRFNENTLNSNGEIMINQCTLNDLRNTRGNRSTIDYIVTSRHIRPEQEVKVRTLNSANMVYDHSLLLGKIRKNIKPASNHNETKQ